ncbi:hypothetical protein WJX73_006289 [Symbiochloris irregularis]|uniref:USP domain-containing protein n=1 Tax=Symbiochloris irregularis TaxID=706552 RepID=A0AAW1NRD6_9CHLO
MREGQRRVVLAIDVLASEAFVSQDVTVISPKGADADDLDGRYKRGTTSSSDAVVGSLHRVTAPLRAALYSRRYGSGFQEFYPEWDSRVRDVRWADEYLEADNRLDAVLDDVKEVRKLVPQLFKGMSVYETICNTCGQPSEGGRQAMGFYELDVQVRAQDILERALETLLGAEELAGDNQYRCEPCACKRNLTRQMRIRALLPLQNPATRVKATDKISFPLEMDLSGLGTPAPKAPPGEHGEQGVQSPAAAEKRALHKNKRKAEAMTASAEGPSRMSFKKEALPPQQQDGGRITSANTYMLMYRRRSPLAAAGKEGGTAAVSTPELHHCQPQLADGSGSTAGAVPGAGAEAPGDP